MENTNEKYLSQTSVSGATIILPLSDPSPEVMAMLQAKYSRDPKSVESHLEDILSGDESSAQKFMSTYYVGYGHRSIGRCGFITLFVENISILAATWVVHTPRFNGQECSTRYLNFFTQGHYEPNPSDLLPDDDWDAVRNLRDELMTFYSEGLEEMIKSLEEKFPYEGPSEDRTKKGQWSRTIRAKAFDVLRGFLPVSCKTNVAITMSLMDFQDHVLFLLSSPLKEAREIGEAMETLLIKAYPSSFRKTKEQELEIYREALLFIKAYPSSFRKLKEQDRKFYRKVLPDLKLCPDSEFLDQKIQVDLHVVIPSLYKDFTSLVSKFSKTKITQYPREYEQSATVRVSGLLDFGSWRDIHRHTSADHSLVQLLPWDFEQWYIDSLPVSLQKRALILVQKCSSLDIQIRSDLLQYSTPMGFKVQSEWTTGVRSLLYIINLRSQDTVHPTLRKFILEVAGNEVLEDICFSLPTDAKEFNLRRGDQTIIAKDQK